MIISGSLYQWPQNYSETCFLKLIVYLSPDWHYRIQNSWSIKDTALHSLSFSQLSHELILILQIFPILESTLVIHYFLCLLSFLLPRGRRVPRYKGIYLNGPSGKSPPDKRIWGLRLRQWGIFNIHLGGWKEIKIIKTREIIYSMTPIDIRN